MEIGALKLHTENSWGRASFLGDLKGFYNLFGESRVFGKLLMTLDILQKVCWKHWVAEWFKLVSKDLSAIKYTVNCPC
jgi:hypothetical protein